jgi:Family of unknown function (DUF6152)
MSKNLQRVSLAVLGLLLSVTSVLAHHSVNAEYDTQKETKITGVITKIEWINPHVSWDVEVKDADGTVNTWKVSNVAPSEWRAAGVKRDMAGKIGDTVTAEGWLARSVPHRFYGKKLTFGDGHSIIVEGSYYRTDPKSF